MKNSVVKKLTAGGLTMIMLAMSGPVNAFAATADPIERNLQFIPTEVCDADFLNTADIDIFKVDADNLTVQYSGEYVLDEENAEMDISLDMMLNFSGEIYRFDANGTLCVYEDTNGRQYVDGLLDGNVTIDGVRCIANIGVQKFLDSDDIYASVVLQNATSWQILSAFSFGTPVLTVENTDAKVVEEFAKTPNVSPEAVYGSYRASTPYSLVSTSYANYSGTPVSGYAQRQRIYYASSLERVAIGVTSYSKNVNDYYKKNAGPLDTVGTGVQEFTVELKRNNANAPSYIVGIEQNENYKSQGQVAKLVMSIFKDAFSALGFPSTLIDAFFPAPGATVKISPNAPNVHKITLNAGMDSFSLDNTSYCAPVIFQMAHSSPSTDAYTATTTMTYKTRYMESSGVLTTYYTKSAPVVKTFTIALK